MVGVVIVTAGVVVMPCSRVVVLPPCSLSSRGREVNLRGGEGGAASEERHHDGLFIEEVRPAVARSLKRGCPAREGD